MIQEGWNKFGKDKCINKNAGGLNHLDLEVVKNAGKKRSDQNLGIFGWTPSTSPSLMVRVVCSTHGQTY